MEYTPNAGQTYYPFQDNIHVPLLPFTPLERPNPLYPPLQLTEEAEQKGYVLQEQMQHFLPGVTAKMLDWWWANMEKGYYLWAPGSHKRFNWVRSPGQYGFLNSSHMISETVGAGKPVFGGNGVQIHRMDLSWYFFKTHLSHVIIEGVFNRKGEFVDSTIHMWEDTEGGCNHITASVANTCCSEPPEFVLAAMEEEKNHPHPVEESAHTNAAEPELPHAEYEASRWPVFLPTLYKLWEGHPDPSQNVPCNLTVAEGADGLYYLEENGPISI